MSGSLCWIETAPLDVSATGWTGSLRDPIAAELAEYLQARPDLAVEVLRQMERLDWEAAHPGETHPGCKGIGGHPCIAWAREGACPHVRQAFWRAP